MDGCTSMEKRDNKFLPIIIRKHNPEKESESQDDGSNKLRFYSANTRCDIHFWLFPNKEQLFECDNKEMKWIRTQCSKNQRNIEYQHYLIR
jgi:hypothetical protein